MVFGYIEENLVVLPWMLDRCGTNWLFASFDQGLARIASLQNNSREAPIRSSKNFLYEGSFKPASIIILCKPP